MQFFSKKKHRADSELRGSAPFWWPKWSTCSENFFFGKSHCYHFHCPIGPFHCKKIKKILTADPELWQCTIFGTKMIHLPQIRFWKTITIILIYLLAFFIVQNLKKIVPVDPELWGCTNPELWGCANFGPKMAYFFKWELFQKTCSRAFFILFMPIYTPKIKVRY